MTDTAVATTAQKPPLVVLRERLEIRKGEIANALPSDITPDQFIRAVMTSAAINPEILGCTFQSIWISIMKACRDGLVPDGQDAAIVAFKSTAQYIAMYPGLLRRFRRSGQFKWVAANPVRKGEEFAHWIDESGEHFRHVPGNDDHAPIEKVYAIAGTKDGATFVAVLSMTEIDKIRSMSRATREDSPWRQWPIEMMRKSAIRRLSKVLPSARDIIGEDDINEVPTAARIVERASPAPVVTSPVVAGAGDEQGAADQSPAAHEETEDRDPAVVEQDDQHRSMLIAYEAGKKAKAQGYLKRAMPGEYRDSSHTREALAWTAGWDGQPMPTFFEIFEKEHQTGDEP